MCMMDGTACLSTARLLRVPLGWYQRFASKLENIKRLQIPVSIGQETSGDRQPMVDRCITTTLKVRKLPCF